MVTFWIVASMVIAEAIVIVAALAADRALNREVRLLEAVVRRREQ